MMIKKDKLLVSYEEMAVLEIEKSIDVVYEGKIYRLEVDRNNHWNIRMEEI